MNHRLLVAALCLMSTVAGAVDYAIDQPPHNYWTRPLNDRFTKIRADLESGRVPLDTSSEQAFLLSLLKVLEVPVSSQMLVFSASSLQLSLISPRNPRALYFNEDVHVGFIPGGRIEIVSLDPEAGGVFYIFPIPREGRPLLAERSTRCMNCHAREDTMFVPGLALKSVIPGPNGGSLVAFRQEQTGHAIPFKERFGGWYLTGEHGITDHQGNYSGRFKAGELIKYPVEAAQTFDPARYPLPTSDILPQLVHEHQVGFVNRVIEATYLTRNLTQTGSLTTAQNAQLDEKARALVRYILFADEVGLPAGGVKGDAAFKADFAKNRHALPSGASLKDFELKSRLFRYRCSYMIYSGVFQGLPPEMKQRVYRRMSEALNVERADKEYAYLPLAEKKAVHAIVKATVKDLPAQW